MTAALAFAEQRVGRTAASEPRAVAEPGLTAPSTAAAVLRLAESLGLLGSGGEGIAGFAWSFAELPRAGERVVLEGTTTRCRALQHERRGRCGLTWPCAPPAGGRSAKAASRQPCRSPIPAPARWPSTCAPTSARGPWAELLAERLAERAEFAAATSTFDGSVELACGADSVQLRIFRGSVLGVGRSMPLGPTFSLAGEEIAWTRLLLAPRNDFIARAMRGEFVARGDRYQYVRMTKAVQAICDCARELAAGRER